MSPEIEIPKDRPTLLLQSMLGDKKVLSHLISQSQGSDNILDKASIDINGLDKTETASFVKLILDGLSRDDAEWDVNKRDAANELLFLVNPEKLDKEQVLQFYLDAVSRQTADSDPYGSISSLVEAGLTIGHHFPIGEETIDKVSNAWSKVADYFEGEDQNFIHGGNNRVIMDIPRALEDLLHTDERLGRRERPTFEPSEEILHAKYLEATQDKGTFKPTLWESVPEFRAICESHGIKLEKFWNMSDPDKVASALEGIDWDKFPQLKAYFEKAVKAETGMRLPDLTFDKAKVVSDEIVKAAERAKKDIIGTIRDFDSTVNVFRVLLDEAKVKGTKAQRSITKDIANFFASNGVPLKALDVDSIANVLSDNSTLELAKLRFEQKQQIKRDSISMLNSAFNLSDEPKDFSLISRQREDLFVGDLTGDCTSYHLYVGMNAWTVPIWLSNPGFNIYKISDGKQLLAKLGILLAISDNKPAIVVDSFEVGRDIQDEEKAKEQIKRGFTYLREWAQRIGFEKVLVNTLSNSSGASEFIGNVAEKSQVEDIYALGGLSGVAELRQQLTGEKAKERIYLQSSAFDSDAEEEEDLTEQDERQGRLVGDFEYVISSTLNQAAPEDRVKVETLAKEQNWPELFGQIMKVKYPSIAALLGNDWKKYSNFLPMIDIDRINSNLTERLSDLQDQLPISVAIEEKIIEEAAEQDIEADDDLFENDPRRKAAGEVDFLILLIKKIYENNLTPEAILKKLYEATTVEKQNDQAEPPKLRLNKRLPRLIV